MLCGTYKDGSTEKEKERERERNQRILNFDWLCLCSVDVIGTYFLTIK